MVLMGSSCLIRCWNAFENFKSDFAGFEVSGSSWFS